MTHAYKPRRKALWFRMQHGDAPKPRRFKPVRKVSSGMARERRLFAAEVKVWIKGKTCVGSPWCLTGAPHKATDPHHIYGRLGPLLRDWRWIKPMCRPGHDGVKSHPVEARTLGLIAGPWNSVPKQQPYV